MSDQAQQDSLPQPYEQDQALTPEVKRYYDFRDEIKSEDGKVELVRSQLKRSVDYRAVWIDPLLRAINKAYFAYKRALAEKHRKRSNIRVWHCFKQVESMIPHIMNAITSPEYPVMLTGLGEDTVQQAAFATQNLLAYQYSFQNKPIKPTYMLIKQNCMYGSAIAKVFWNYKRGYVYDMEPEFDSQGNPVSYKPKKREAAAKQSPFFIPINLDSFYWEPSGTDISECGYCIHICKMTMRDLYLLKKKAKGGGIFFNLDKIEPHMPLRRSQGIITNSDNLFDHQRGGKTSPGADLNKTFADVNYCVEYIEYHEPDRILGVVNGDVLVRESNSLLDQGELPFIKFDHIPQDNDFLGTGVVEPIVDLDKEANFKRNQRIDNINICINKMFKVKKGLTAWPKTIESSPGKVIPVEESVENLEEIPTGDVTQSSFQEEGIAVNNMDETNGNFADVIRGEQSDRKEQATIYVGRSNAAKSRIGVVTMLMKEKWVVMFEMFHALNRRFLPDGVSYRILGAAGAGVPSRKYNRDDLFNDYEFAFGDVGFWGNNQVEFAKLSQMLPILIQSPAADQATIVTDMARCLGVKDPYRWVKKMPQMGNFSDPRKENVIMLQDGRPLTVSPMDDHANHHFYHKMLTDNINPSQIAPAAMAALQAHDAQHIQYLVASMMQMMGQRPELPGNNGQATFSTVNPGQVPAQNEASLAQNAGNAASAGMVPGNA